MIVVLTGAGVSAPSGLPTLRGKTGGLWDSEYLERLAHITEAVNRPMEYWRIWGGHREQFRDAEPNAAHYALADLQRREPDMLLVTQNVDGLHQKAGSTDVQELHGTLYKNRCRNRRCPQEDWLDFESHRQPPTCPVCGAFVFPATTFFGEYVERGPLKMAMAALERCSMYIVVGSSGVVPPAARFVDIAKQAGARTVLVNDEDWSDGSLFDEVVLGSCDEVLGEFLACPRSPIR